MTSLLIFVGVPLVLFALGVWAARRWADDPTHEPHAIWPLDPDGDPDPEWKDLP